MIIEHVMPTGPIRLQPEQHGRKTPNSATLMLSGQNAMAIKSWAHHEESQGDGTSVSTTQGERVCGSYACSLLSRW